METIDITLGIEDFEWYFWLSVITVLLISLSVVVIFCRNISLSRKQVMKVSLVSFPLILALSMISSFLTFQDVIFNNHIKNNYDVYFREQVSKSHLPDITINPLTSIAWTNNSNFGLVTFKYLGGQHHIASYSYDGLISLTRKITSSFSYAASPFSSENNMTKDE